MIFTNMQRLNCLSISLLVILLLTPIVSFAQIETGSFEFGGIQRDYIVFLPKSYNGVAEMPVVFNLHGYTLNAEQQMNYSRMNAVADTAGFIVVYPNAVNTVWNSGISDNPLVLAPNVDDVGFINSLIDTLDTHYRINKQMIYSCGFSNGGFMSYKLACQLSNRIAAVASVSGVLSYTTANNCNSIQRDVLPVLIIHGTDDLIVPYNGSIGWHSVEYTVNHWTNFNLCTEPDTTSLQDIDSSDGCTVKKITYTNSSDSIGVIFYKVVNGGHTWPQGDKQHLIINWGDISKTNGDINASLEIWNFFRNYKLSELTTVAADSESPIKYQLFQNYPNPFNAITKIQYTVKAVETRHASPLQHVTLKVYDVLGNEVATLVNKEKPAGSYEVTFDANNLPSGIYFYQIKAGGYNQTKKMVLLK